MRTRTLLIRPAGLAAGLAALAAAALTAAVPSQAASSATASGSLRRAGIPASAPLTTARAMAIARATRKPVTVTSLTTPDSVTTANPDGKLTLTQTLLPTRTWQPGQGRGRWVPLSARLVKSGRRLAPAATAAPLTLSAGGSGPLAVLSSAGRTLALNWPGTLPAPTVSGSAATYANVLPGVDLVLTADTLGGVNTTLVIRSAAAAANPALQTLLTVTVTPSPGLQLSADAAGNLSVGAPGAAQPVFSAQAPQMWDSAPPPAGTATVTGPSGQVLIAGSGMPAYSSATAPGDGARVTSVPVTVTGNTLTLTPPAAALTGPGVAYPLYIDPPWHNSVPGNASNWAQIESGNPTQTFWPSGTDLQLGNCTKWGNCSIGTERDFFTLPISSKLTNAVIQYSYIYMTDEWAPACNLSQAQGEVDLYTVKPVSNSSAPTWNSQSSWWQSKIASQAFAFQNPAWAPGTSCPDSTHPNVTWDVTGTIKADAGEVSSQSFGLQAADESGDGMGWKQFWSGAGNITIVTEYNYSPYRPYEPSANGGCGSSTQPTQIGNDDVTFTAYQNDEDGDTSLSTKFTIWNSDGTQADQFTTATGAKGWVPTTVSRTTIQNIWHADGATKAYTYHWSATTTDGFPTTPGVSGTCYFTYDPNGPAAPGLTVSPATVALGGTVTATFTPPAGCSPATTPCPTSYIYQIGAAAPQTATVGATGCTASSCQVTITAAKYGPEDISVSGVANGNPGSAAPPAQIDVTSPATPYTDGYFSGGTYPDLLAAGTGSNPSLWIYPGTGNGTLGPGIDIGSTGTGINPGTGSPADWATGDTQHPLQELHGDFTGHHVQDVIAYYPGGTHAGTAVLIAGDGLDATMQPANDPALPQAAWFDPNFSNSPTTPLQLVPAGKASQLNTDLPGLPDLIGIYPSGTGSYELALYPTSRGQAFNYGPWPQQSGPYQLSAGHGPDGSTWDKFQLATAQPAGHPEATVLFALDTSNGQLWESVNGSAASPGCPPANPALPCSTTALIGTGTVGTSTSTWTKLSVPWGTTPPKLVSADINQAGQTELWTTSGGTATAYTLNTTTNTITAEGAANPLTTPNNEWPLTDGAGNCSPPGTSPATAADTIGSATATLTGGYGWACDGTDSTFNTALALDGTTASAATSGPVLNTTGSYSVAAWVNLANVTGWRTAVAQSGTQGSAFYLQLDSITSTFDFARLPSDTHGAIGTRAVSSVQAAPGIWYQLVGTYNASTGAMDLYVNGTLAATATDTTKWSATGPLTIGRALYNGSPTDFVDGQISGVQDWSYTLTASQVTALYKQNN